MARESARSSGHGNADLAEEVARGLASAEAGRLVPYESVRRWILSWGTGAELDPPQCK